MAGTTPSGDDLNKAPGETDPTDLTRLSEAGELELPDGEIQIDLEKGNHVIVGSGGAGFAAAVTLRKEGFDGRVILATAEMDLPYFRPSLSKGFLEGTVKEDEVFLKHENFYQEAKIEILAAHQLVAVDPKEKTLRFASSYTLPYEKLLLATGGIPRTPDAEGVHKPNFFLLRSLEDARAVRSRAERARKAVVVGAGLLGLEAAAALSRRGLEVHVVAPESSILEELFGDRVGKLLEKMHRDNGVVFHLDVFADEFRGEPEINEVLLSDETVLGADLVVAGIGVLPAVHALDEAGVVDEWKIPVDGAFRTKVPDIFAAGDIAEVPDPVSGKTGRIEHWVEAQRQGRHAARSMLGFEVRYDEPPFFWTQQYDRVLKYVGSSGEFSKVVYRGDVEAGDFLAGYYQGSRLMAAAGMGRDQDISVLYQVLKQGKSPTTRQFHKAGFDFKQLLL
jgi:NADPH-dependent 2,4-dienoyl-CoA reductase/sulfur reductase-like enzyme